MENKCFPAQIDRDTVKPRKANQVRFPSRSANFLWRGMAYQYVREPLSSEDSDRLANACKTVQEKLIVWPMLDGGLRVSELCGLTPNNIQWQQRCLRIKGKGGPYGTKSKVRVVPMSARVRTIFEPYFALNDEFPVAIRRAQKIVKTAPVYRPKSHRTFCVTRLRLSICRKAARLPPSRRYSGMIGYRPPRSI